MSLDVQLQVDNTQLNDYIKEYLRYNNFINTLECFEAEIRTKQVSKQLQVKPKDLEPRKSQDLPRFYAMLKGESVKVKREMDLEKELGYISRRLLQILQASRHIFSIAVSLVQLCSSVKETVNDQKFEERLENSKISLGKYHLLVTSEDGGKNFKESISEAECQEIKKDVQRHFQERNVEKLAESLLSVRVRCLKTVDEKKAQCVHELIRSDILFFGKVENNNKSQVQEVKSSRVLENKSQKDFAEGQNELAQSKLIPEGAGTDEKKEPSFLVQLLGLPSHEVKYALISVLSLIASTKEGISYIMQAGPNILIPVVFKIMKEQDVASVIERFCAAFLQKCSLDENLIPFYFEAEAHAWALDILQRAMRGEAQHLFTLEFAAATFENMMNTEFAFLFLQENIETFKTIVEASLKLLKAKFSSSIYQNIIRGLMIFRLKPFSAYTTEFFIEDNIRQFVGKYSDENVAEIHSEEKRSVLEVCSRLLEDIGEEPPEREAVDNPEKNGENAVPLFEVFPDEIK